MALQGRFCTVSRRRCYLHSFHHVRSLNANAQDRDAGFLSNFTRALRAALSIKWKSNNQPCNRDYDTNPPSNLVSLFDTYQIVRSIEINTKEEIVINLVKSVKESSILNYLKRLSLKVKRSNHSYRIEFAIFNEDMYHLDCGFLCILQI